jgi:hypothetical protein
MQAHLANSPSGANSGPAGRAGGDGARAPVGQSSVLCFHQPGKAEVLEDLHGTSGIELSSLLRNRWPECCARVQ